MCYGKDLLVSRNRAICGSLVWLPYASNLTISTETYFHIFQYLIEVPYFYYGVLLYLTLVSESYTYNEIN